MRSRPFLLLLLVAVAPVLFGQLLVETIEVRVTNVDVVVTDRSGKPVHGLTKDDFEVYEDGKLQPITNFYELRDSAAEAVAASESLGAPAAPPAELQRRRLVIFVDQESVDPRRRADAFAAVMASIDRMLRPDDEAMVISFYRDRRVLAEFTSDRGAVKKALSEAASQAIGTGLRQTARDRVIAQATETLSFARSNPRLMPMADAYRSVSATASAYADELYAQQKKLVAALQQTVTSMAGMEGKKVIVFVGGDLQQRPGVDVFDAVDAMFRSTGVAVVNSANAGQGTRRSLGTELEKLGKDANANGVTLYLIDATDKTGRKNASEAAHVDQNVGVDAGIDLESAVSMTVLANATGGAALVASSNYELALNNVARDLSSYYSIGYRPANGEGTHSIVVKAKKPGLNVRSRRSYTLVSPDEEMNSRVVANAFHPRISSEMAVSVQVGKAQPEGDVFKVPVTVRFPGDVTAIPDGSGSLAGEFTVYFVTATPTGNLSPVAKDVRPFKYPAAQARAIQSQPITYTSGLRVRAGEQIISVAVVDRLGGRAGYGRVKFTVP